MDIFYNVSGKSSKGQINGYVIVNSQSALVNGAPQYSVVSCLFSCNGATCGSATGSDAGILSIPPGQSLNDVYPGNGLWRLGSWVANTGIWFKHVDNSIYLEKLSEYQCLPPIIDLCCDNVDINSSGPFLPYGHLILTWNPHKIPSPPTNLHIS